MIPLVIVGIASGIVGIGVSYINSLNLKEKAEILPSLIKLLYAFANADFIHKKEHDEIRNFCNNYLADLEKQKYDGLQNLREEIKKISLNSANIKLSEALEALVDVKNYENYLKELPDIVQADGIISKEEIVIINRFKRFIENPDKQSIINQIKEEENQEKEFLTLPPHYRYMPNNEYDHLVKENGLIEINSQNNRFLNISDICENEYYIHHPKNSDYLFPISKMDDIIDDTMDEFISIASSLGAMEIKVSMYRYEKELDSSKKDFTVGGVKEGVGAELSFNQSSGDERYSKVEHIKERTFKTGQKENREVVERKLIWTKGDTRTKDLIDRAFSNNPHSEWKHDAYLKTFTKGVNKITFAGALKLAELYNIDINAKAEKEFEREKEEKIQIYIKF